MIMIMHCLPTEDVVTIRAIAASVASKGISLLSVEEVVRVLTILFVSFVARKVTTKQTAMATLQHSKHTSHRKLLTCVLMLPCKAWEGPCNWRHPSLFVMRGVAFLGGCRG